MKATFIGDCSPNLACRVFGTDFPPNVAVSVDHLSDKQQAKLTGNAAFKVTGKGAPVVAVEPVPQPEPDPESDIDPDVVAEPEAKA